MHFEKKAWKDVAVDESGIYYMYGSIPMKCQKIDENTMNLWDAKGSGPVPFAAFVPELTEIEVRVT
jgi:hypothetical protein